MNVAPARWQSTSASGRQPCSSPSVTPEYAGMARARPGPRRTAAARARRPRHQPRGRARDEVRDHVVDGDAPAGDRDPGLAGGDERRPQAARARRRVELQRHRHLADRAVRADGVHDPRVRPLRRPGGHAQPGRRGPQVAQLDARRGGRGRQLRVLARAPCAARPRRASRPRSPPAAPPATRRSARRRTAPRRSPVRSSPALRPPRRSPRWAPRGARRARRRTATAPAETVVDDADDLTRSVAQDAVRGLRVGRREDAAGEQREPVSHGPAPRRGPGARRAPAGRPRARAR